MMSEAPGPALPPPPAPHKRHPYAALMWGVAASSVIVLTLVAVLDKLGEAAPASSSQGYVRSFGESYTPGYGIFVTIGRPVCQASGDCKAQVTIVNKSDRYPYQLDYHTVSSPTTETTTSGMDATPLWPGREWTYQVKFKGTPSTPLTFTPSLATQVSLPPGLDMTSKVTWR